MECKPNIKMDCSALEKLSNPYKKLWAAVLLKAIEDIDEEDDDIARDSAIYWLKSDNDKFCSFINVCEILDINPLKIKTLLKEKLNED